MKKQRLTVGFTNRDAQNISNLYRVPVFLDLPKIEVLFHGPVQCRLQRRLTRLETPADTALYLHLLHAYRCA
jgi:hypothetical protein